MNYIRLRAGLAKTRWLKPSLRVAGQTVAAVDDQAATTRHISENVQAAAGSTSHVAASIGEVNKSATGITAASTQLLASAQTLAQDGSRLSSEMEKFLAAVYAA